MSCAIAADTRKIAALIAGTDDPCSRLVAGLEFGRQYVAMIIRGEQAWPGRQELREKLTDLESAAKQMRVLLADPAVRQFFRYDLPTRRELLTEREATIYLRWVGARARREVASIRDGRGRDKHPVDPNGMSAPALCAAVVAVAWQRTRGEAVAHSSVWAQRACAELWRAAGGQNRSWGQEPSGWLRWLKEAKAAQASGSVAIMDDWFRGTPPPAQ